MMKHIEKQNDNKNYIIKKYFRMDNVLSFCPDYAAFFKFQFGET